MPTFVTLVFLLPVFCPYLGSASSLLRDGNIRVVGLPPPVPNEGYEVPPEQWMTQQLDHFDHTNMQVSLSLSLASPNTCLLYTSDAADE